MYSSKLTFLPNTLRCLCLPVFCLQIHIYHSSHYNAHSSLLTSHLLVTHHASLLTSHYSHFIPNFSLLTAWLLLTSSSLFCIHCSFLTSLLLLLTYYPLLLTSHYFTLHTANFFIAHSLLLTLHCLFFTPNFSCSLFLIHFSLATPSY